MSFVFSRRFYILLAFGLVPLSLSWNFPVLRWLVLLYDIGLLAAALADNHLSQKAVNDLEAARLFRGRFTIGERSQVCIRLVNRSDSSISLKIKDEFPPQMTLDDEREATTAMEPRTTAEFFYHVTPPRRGKYSFGRIAVRFSSQFGLVWCQADLGGPQDIKVYPNMRRAREIELKALGARSFIAIQRRSALRGEGREFESLRDYVRGDELRHLSWTATARRSKLTTRQFQIERDQTVLIAIDSGRLMTGRIGRETKFETAVHSALALMSACSRSGDHCGLLIFGRGVKRFLPPKRGIDHIDAVLEALHDLEPEFIEPSYSRAFQFVSSNSKKRSLVVILTDIVDKDSSRELINSLKLLRPRHLPLVVTIGDRDLNAVVSEKPADVRDVFTQSAAEEIIHQRESALRLAESLGGLALDVTTQTLGPKLVETYLRIKERGLL